MVIDSEIDAIPDTEHEVQTHPEGECFEDDSQAQASQDTQAGEPQDTQETQARRTRRKHSRNNHRRTQNNHRRTQNNHRRTHPKRNHCNRFYIFSAILQKRQLLAGSLLFCNGLTTTIFRYARNWWIWRTLNL